MTRKGTVEMTTFFIVISSATQRPLAGAAMNLTGINPEKADFSGFEACFEAYFEAWVSV